MEEIELQLQEALKDKIYYRNIAESLRAENKAQKDKIAELEKALAHMRYAYINKDEPPHNFETMALEIADRLLEGKNMIELLKEDNNG